jgi:hypothetical protein
MNFALRGIEADFGSSHCDNARSDFHNGFRRDMSRESGDWK